MKYSLVILLLVFAACIAKADVEDSTSLTDLALGKPGLKQQVESKNIAPGVHFHQVLRGHSSPKDFYTLSTGIVSSQLASILQQKLAGLGYDSRLELSAEKGPHGEELGNIVRVGKFVQKQQAQLMADKILAQGIKMAVRYTAEDGGSSQGPFQISLLELDLNKYQGRIVAALAQQQIQGKETTSAIAERHATLAAVNAGFFSWKPEVGTPGDLAGISVVDGELVSEATAGRAVLLFRHKPKLSVKILHDVQSVTLLTAGQKELRVQGLNRVPGKVLNCGGTDDPLLTRAAHDHVCHNPNEVIVYTPSFGDEVNLPAGKVFVFAEGKPVSEQLINAEKTFDIPERGMLVHLSGNKAETVDFNQGEPVTLSSYLETAQGRVVLKKGDYAFNGGPTLLLEGKLPMSIRAKEGWDTSYPEVEIDNRYVDKKDKAAISHNPHSRAGFYHGWVVRRHPRTAVGITAGGKLYIAVVYGRQPGVTAGASVTEMALLMQRLGATEAFNLDGGGSSMMVVQGKNTGLSSDREGERAVGDALLLLP